MKTSYHSAVIAILAFATIGSASAALRSSFPVLGDVAATSATRLAEFRAQADPLYRLKEKAFADQDAATIADRFYANNALAVGPDGKPIIGRDQLRAEYTQFVKMGTVKIEPWRTQVGQDVAYEWVNFRGVPRDAGKPPMTFITLFLWVKQNGQWTCAGDMVAIGELPAGR